MLMTQLTMIAIVIWIVCVAGDVVVVVVLRLLLMVLALLYRDQFLLGDKKTLSPNPFPSLCAIALLAVDPELGPCSSTVDSVE